ncbi:preprotein translocase subunit SecE [Gordonia liuliyuniae]|uniref:Protein translocase subunit SecE n=1 Tax=Gordonia liuliyuniae TaxID=2911517 RepID=A0ABS9IVU4_9ACTN|nr:preprotein translocase subunit SecE [Gordonia liuliyuniae]MCF8589694.1 preprotein translocase subunit SecE [Gordonia liuliyuniae]
MAKRDRKAGDVDDSIEVDDIRADELRPSGKRSTRGRRADSGTAVATKSRAAEAAPSTSRNPFVRIWVFLKQVVSEMRKVVWPTRNDMVNYTIAVLAFLVVLTAIIAGLDIGFAKLMLQVFG